MISTNASSTQRHIAAPQAPYINETLDPERDALLHALSLARRATELDSQAQYRLALDAYENAIGSIYRFLLAAVGESSTTTDLDEEGKRRLEGIVGSYEERVVVLRTILQVR